MTKLTLKCEKVLGGVKLPAGYFLASVEPTASLADVRLVVQLGAGDLVETEAAHADLVLTRTKVLGGQVCVDGHRVAALALPEGVALADVRLVLLTGEYELVDEALVEPPAVVADVDDEISGVPARGRRGKAGPE